MEPTKLTHLSLIQNIISRLASNCFAVKGWSLLILTGSFAVTELTNANTTANLFLFSVFLCWQLDAYYLNLEREYRKFYEQVSNSAPDESLKLRLPNRLSIASHVSTSLSISIFPIYITEAAFLSILYLSK